MIGVCYGMCSNRPVILNELAKGRVAIETIVPKSVWLAALHKLLSIEQ